LGKETKNQKSTKQSRKIINKHHLEKEKKRESKKHRIDRNKEKQKS
jgi:hypothetical protein